MESTKKVWRPESKQQKPINTASANQSTARDSRTSGNKSSATSVSSGREFGSAAVRPGSVASTEASWNSASKISSKNMSKPNRSGDRMKENAISVAVKNQQESQNGEMVNNNSRRATMKSSGTENGLPNNVSAVDAAANFDAVPSAVMPSANRRLSDANEPTKQPVAARLAAWKKKTAAVENASTLSQHSASRDKLHTITEARGSCGHVSTDQDSHNDIVCQANASSNTDVSTGKAADSALATRDILDNNSKPSFPPLKDGEVRQRTLPRRIPPSKQGTAQPSWKKLGPATFEIQQKLTAMCENWKKNEIAEKSQKERAEDLAVLENRWRNGMVADDQKQAVLPAVCMSLTESEIASHTQVHEWILENS